MEFQVLAYNPLAGSVPPTDAADLAGVPNSELSRVVRMTATQGLPRGAAARPGLPHGPVRALRDEAVLPRRRHAPRLDGGSHAAVRTGTRPVTGARWLRRQLS